MATEATPKVWADGPYQLITAEKSRPEPDGTQSAAKYMAAEMTIVHNCILRGVNAIYHQAVNVADKGTKKDKLDFAHFTAQWGDMIHEHHGLEESTIFPQIEQMTGVPGLMAANVREHEQFHSGLSALNEYLDKVKREVEELDGVKLRDLVDAFMPVLRDHLDNEIDTLLGLADYEDKHDWKKWFENISSGIIKAVFSNPTLRNDIFPLTLVLHDKKFEQGVFKTFPPMPWVLHVAVRWLFMNTRKDWWRFAPCDFYSMPKELPFV